MKNIRINVLDKNHHIEVIDFKVDLLLLAGWTGRDKESVMKHIKELEAIGIPRPKKIPALYPISSYLINTYNEIEVQTQQTSGEVEYVLFINENIEYITVGSDHTDREIEKIDIKKSKQMYPKIIPPIVWKYDDVKDHWDELILVSKQWINGEEILYQNSSIKALITPSELLKIINDYGLSCKNLIVFSGTIPTITNKLMFGEKFRMEIIDPLLNRHILYEYNIKQLPKVD